MAIYRGNVKVSGIGKSFNPENSGTEGQVLTKTITGYAFCDSQGGGGASGPMVDLLVVAGGGAGGSHDGSCGGGGGGAGGFFECGGYKINSNPTNIVIGAGGTRVSGNWCSGNNGGDTCFGDLKMCGGGGGGGAGRNGCDGGNGGGAGGAGTNSGQQGGISFGFGHQGGGAACNSTKGGGGGGAGGQGGYGVACQSSQLGGAPGQGCFSRFFCPGCLFANGGWGKIKDGTPTGYLTCKFYGAGGDGAGGYTGNTGNGCSGVVMLRYPTDGSYGISSSTGGNCCFTCDGYCYVEFTSDGTFTPTLA